MSGPLNGQPFTTSPPTSALPRASLTSPVRSPAADELELSPGSLATATFPEPSTYRPPSLTRAALDEHDERDNQDQSQGSDIDDEQDQRRRSCAPSRRSTRHSGRTNASGFYSSEDLSPQSVFATSLRRQTVPDLEMPTDHRPMPASSRSPRRDSLDDDFGATSALQIAMPDRPPLLTAGSSSVAGSTSPLLGDVSGANTPITPFEDDPFHDDPRSRSSSDSLSPPPPPKLQLNNSSLPNSPDPEDIPHFTPDILPMTTASRRQSSLHGLANFTFESTPGSINSAPSSTSALQSRSTIAQRRSQRTKDAKRGKKGKGDEKDQPAKTAMNRKPFQSTRLKGEIYKPWLEQKDPAQRTARWITIASIVLGFAIMAVICWDGYNSVPNLGKICLVLDEDFSNGIDSNTWLHEIRLDGYGHGSFEWTTASPNNSYTKDGILYIVPTLTADVLGDTAISNGYTLNLTADGTCTSTNVSNCVAVSNSSRLTVINPVQSARLTTLNSVNLNYGKVEVTARFPTGDWLWPSISMMPVNESYGPWPRSGQVDILTARGNNASYPQRGVDYAQSDLHWGPDTDLDALYLTWGYREQRRTYYNQRFHTYGFEWNDKYMWTYIDSKVSQVVSLRFNKESFWERGKFPSTITNTTTGDVEKLVNPWLSSETNVAPFDKPFYLVLGLAVGGIDGWFPDGEGGKPWLDNSGTGMSDFWNAKTKWWTDSWPQEPEKRGFAIDSVKMWKTC